jgi:hypothetical protein
MEPRSEASEHTIAVSSKRRGRCAETADEFAIVSNTDSDGVAEENGG